LVVLFSMVFIVNQVFFMSFLLLSNTLW
jgi:hypothetical protein